MKKQHERFFKPLPLLRGGRALLLRILMIPNYFLVRADGLENLSTEKSASIYAFNHNNSLEALMVPAFLIYHLGGRTVSFVVDWMYGRIPVLGSVMNMTDPVYVYNKRCTIPWIEAGRPSFPMEDTVVERCSRKIRSGRSIGIFPEGRRNRNPQTLERGKPGIGHIALQTGADVVPVGIDFTCRRTKQKIPLLGRTIIRIGRPLKFRQQYEAYQAFRNEAGGSNQQNAEKNRMAADVTHEIMRSLAELSGKSCSEVRQGKGGLPEKP